VDLAQRAAGPAGPDGDRRTHVGYFLIGDGRAELEGATRMRVSLARGMLRFCRRHLLVCYVGAIIGFTAAGAAPLTGLLLADELEWWTRVVLFALTLLCASQLGVTIVNWLATLFVKPSPLPRLDFSGGIPSSHATVVAVPTMLVNLGAIDRMIEALEVHYLGNRDDHLHFALLTDFRDAPQERMPDDEPLVQRALRGIEALNEKYRGDRPGIFFLFHRPRRWNEHEGVWMGYERKRGKLADLNRVLRGGSPEVFSHIAGDLSVLPHIQYVIVLDSDTQLPRDTARQLAATMAHPLNRPIIDTRRGVIVEGYSILQPRVAVSLPSSDRSRFVKLFAGEPGIDPYTRAVSDVYQDVFREGSFIGKGIYDVDAFEQAVGGKFPENRILSHDLLEGSYARSALVSDIQLFEDYPARYSTDVQRRHRWIRGDWQIATWLLPRLPGPDVRRVQNPLSGLSRWKIFDNLRRSVVPLALAALLVSGWLAFPHLALPWTLGIVAIIAVPGVLAIATELLRKPRETPWVLHARHVARAAGIQAAQALLTISFLAFDACVSLDAILRTLGRLLFTRRKLLEWQTSREVERADSGSLLTFIGSMWGGVALAVALALGLEYGGGTTLPVAAPFLILWAISPVVAWWISRPLADERPRLSEEQARELRLL
ncbi:MAG: cyclic beta 1-2 glucan synthetase, partial [Opitutaceae bacterium]